MSITSTDGDTACDDDATDTLCLTWSNDGKVATGSQTVSVQTNNPTGYTVTVDNGDGLLHPADAEVSSSSTNATTIPFTYEVREADKAKVKTNAMNSTPNNISYNWSATPDKPNYLTNMDSYSQKVVYYATANDAYSQTVNPDGKTYEFTYTGSSQTFTAPYSGKYKIEVWGASGGFNNNTLVDDSGLAHGGYGGYSIGEIALKQGDKIFVAVGNHGAKYFDGDNDDTRFNGGGAAGGAGAAGGGATSVYNALIGDGQLKNYADDKSNVIIVAGGGGGNDWTINQQGDTSFGDAGGYIGNYGTMGANDNSHGLASVYTGKATACPGTQIATNECATWRQDIGETGNWTGIVTAPGFGYGGDSPAVYSESGEMTVDAGGAGGGGWYGGYSEIWGIGAGGSGYIGSNLLTNKHMYGYDVVTSDEASTKTIAGTCASEAPVADCAKIGDGFVRITYIGAN